MRIKKVRINNYRSVQNSGDIYLEEKVTILAGKNESGKTAILEALEDFDKDKEIRKEAKPIFNEEAVSQVAVTFTLSADEVNPLLQTIGLEGKEEKSCDLTITKTFPKTYDLDGDTSKWLNGKLDGQANETRKAIKGKASSISSALKKNESVGLAFPELDFSDTASLVKQLTDFQQQLTPLLPKIEDETQRNAATQDLAEAVKLAQQLQATLDLVRKFTDALVKSTPNFIYFDSFENLLPFQIPLAEAKKNKAVLNFAKISEIDLDLLLNAERTRQQNINYLSRKSTTITGDFLDFWNQDKVELEAMLDGDNLVFGFVEEGKSEKFSMQQRSKGFQWFLSFYIQLKLHYESGTQNYLLVDEPGLYLHAKAQRDVLSVLEDRSAKMPVIFSTHSPYLLDPDKLDRVRLVFRGREDGTTVESKIHKVSDKETLTPILTAIGLEITSGITNPDKLNNVVVEGPSDWYYLTSFKTILDDGQLNFIYGGGSGNVPKVGTILHGWGCKVLYLYDSDQGKKDGEKNLTKRWLVEKAQIKAVSDSDGVRIEDLFTQEDFINHVLEDSSKTYKSSNSEYVTKAKADKVLLAKKFLSRATEMKDKLSKDTKENFKKVFEVLIKEFSSEEKAKV
jgi:predicted ATP-dependent endonuclease of OLD family